MMVGRMWIRQAGMTVAARTTARISFVTAPFSSVTFSARQPTPVSKALSHEKPTRIAKAWTTARIALSAFASVLSSSAIWSSVQIMDREMAVTKSARMTVLSTPPSVIRKKWPEINQSALKKRHHEKVIATTFRSCGVKRFNFAFTYINRKTSRIAKISPALKRSRTWKSLCFDCKASGSSPSLLGSQPPMRKRKVCTTMKETTKPTTSSSVSSVSSSHASSHASTLPSPAFNFSR
mmetsp:Transcript_47279/g.101207  ORF Transcript_47279/g.101207 Transcript_47279/m.101207 type:complete len:236 (-) Transcript_47279:415-1122(-)